MTRRFTGTSLAYGLVERFKVPARMHRLAFRDKLAIIMYHGVVREPLPIGDYCFIEEDQFAEEIHYLAQETEVLLLETALERMRCGGLSEPTVAITFESLPPKRIARYATATRAATMSAIFRTLGRLAGFDRGPVVLCRVS